MTTEAWVPRAPALQQEKPPQEEACIPQLESNPCAATKIQHSPKKNNKGTLKKEKGIEHLKKLNQSSALCTI